MHATRSVRIFLHAHPRAWDLAAGLPLILFNGFAAAGFAIQVLKTQVSPSFIDNLQLASAFGSFVFFAMETVLVCIRRLPLRKLGGVLPRLTALAAANIPFALVLLPRRHLSLPWAIASVALLLIGTVGGIVTLAFLRRSFAILPQARQLVTTGPYRYTRHPLYLFGQASLLGVSLQFAQPWAIMIVAACYLLQFPRMRYEEQILLETFPGYADYRDKTAMIVPGLF
jgi:protein-S-isoprenylcysteine O-methyltransferase Ste14